MEEKNALNYLLENGIGFSDIQSYQKAGISLDELCAAVESRVNRGVPPAGDPKEKRDDQCPALTLELFSDFLKEAGISVRYNVISKEFQMDGIPSRFNPETLASDLHIILRSEERRVGKECL